MARLVQKVPAIDVTSGQAWASYTEEDEANIVTAEALRIGIRFTDDTDGISPSGLVLAMPLAEAEAFHASLVAALQDARDWRDKL